MKKLIFCVLANILISFTGFSQTISELLNSQISIIVAKDGSGNFRTIKEAISAVPNNSFNTTLIFVKNGTYYEKVEIPSSKTNLTIVGENVNNTIISYNDYSGSGKIYQGVLTWANGKEIGTVTSHSMYVGADNVSLMNLTIQNTAGNVGQAVALNTECDKFLLYHCRLISYQDTYYTRGSGRFYIKESYIEGAVDYIFGTGVAYFEDCQIHSMRSGAYITAAATAQGFKFGYVFKNCKLTAGNSYNNIYLGRPWKAYGQTVFVNCEEGSFISSAGWHEWSSAPENSNTCYYAEYGNCGAGAATGGRVYWSHRLSDSEAANYTMQNIFGQYVNPTPYSSAWSPNIVNNTIVQAVKNTVDPFVTSACYIVKPDCEAIISVDGDLSFYDGQSVTLTASEGVSYQWMKDGNFINGAVEQTYKATESGTYSVQVTNAQSCVATSDGFTVSVLPIPFDCNGDAFGEAYTDQCGKCVGGNTGMEPCTVEKLQAEDLQDYQSAFEDKNIGFEGSGYINSENAIDVGETIVVFAEEATEIQWGFAYANGSTDDRFSSISVNETVVEESLSLPSTGDWTNWEYKYVTLNVVKGLNKISIKALTDGGLVNIDYFTLYGDANFAIKDTQYITIHKGWNLISTNIYTDNNEISKIFGSINILQIKNDRTFWDVDNPYYANNLYTIDFGKGYFVESNEEGTVSIEGYGVPNYKKAYVLHEGWNMAGCPYSSSLPIKEIEGAAIVKNLDGFWEKDESANSIDAIVPGNGYFIFK